MEGGTTFHFVTGGRSLLRLAEETVAALRDTERARVVFAMSEVEKLSVRTRPPARVRHAALRSETW